MLAANSAVQLAETFFWKAHNSAQKNGDSAAMALSLGNIATIQKMVFKDVVQAEQLYKRAIECDPRHPILRRNFARLYHDFFEEKVYVLTAVVCGKVSKELKKSSLLKKGRSAFQLGSVAEAEYRAALSLCHIGSKPKELSGKALKVDLCLNLAGLISQDAMGNRWPEARALYEMAHDCDPGNLEAALGCASIMWDRENRLHHAENIIKTALEANSRKIAAKKQWGTVKRSVGLMGKFLGLKADNIKVGGQQKTVAMSLMHESLYVDLSHFEAKTCEMKASSVYRNLDSFGAAAAFSSDESKEWATSSTLQNVGEWLYVQYSVAYIVTMVKIKQRKVFAQMVRKLAIYFDAGENREVLLLPEVNEQEITFDPPILSRVVRFEILQVYGEAVTGLNSIRVYGQHRSAADLTLKYDSAALKLEALREQTQPLLTQMAKTHEHNLLSETSVMHAKMLLAKDEEHARLDGVRMMMEYFHDMPTQKVEFPHLFSAALSAYGAYVLANDRPCTLGALQEHPWLPFAASDEPRVQGEQLLNMALEVFAPNADAQVTLQHTATHCNTLQHTATHCNTLQHTAIYCT